MKCNVAHQEEQRHLQKKEFRYLLREVEQFRQRTSRVVYTSVHILFAYQYHQNRRTVFTEAYFWCSSFNYLLHVQQVYSNDDWKTINNEFFWTAKYTGAITFGPPIKRDVATQQKYNAAWAFMFIFRIIQNIWAISPKHVQFIQRSSSTSSSPQRKSHWRSAAQKATKALLGFLKTSGLNERMTVL